MSAPKTLALLRRLEAEYRDTDAPILAEAREAISELAGIRASAVTAVGDWVQNERAFLYDRSGGDLRGVAANIKSTAEFYAEHCRMPTYEEADAL